MNTCPCPQHRSVETFLVLDPIPGWSHVRENTCISRYDSEREACEASQDDWHKKRHPAFHATRRAALHDARRRLKAHRIYRQAWKRVGVKA